MVILSGAGNVPPIRTALWKTWTYNQMKSSSSWRIKLLGVNLYHTSTIPWSPRAANDDDEYHVSIAIKATLKGRMEHLTIQMKSNMTCNQTYQYAFVFRHVFCIWWPQIFTQKNKKITHSACSPSTSILPSVVSSSTTSSSASVLIRFSSLPFSSLSSVLTSLPEDDDPLVSPSSSSQFFLLAGLCVKIRGDQWAKHPKFTSI